jgi:hypothetical protein
MIELIQEKFQKSFNQLSKTLNLFNLRCSCLAIEISLTFKQKYITGQEPEYHYSLQSEVFGTETFYGSYEEVYEHATQYCIMLSQQMIESMLANKEEWYKDKPELQKQVIQLYEEVI